MSSPAASKTAEFRMHRTMRLAISETAGLLVHIFAFLRVGDRVWHAAEVMLYNADEHFIPNLIILDITVLSRDQRCVFSR